MIGRFLKNVFYWQYSRGSWQWDLSCLVFILIIFTTPHDFLSQYSHHLLSPEQIQFMLSQKLQHLMQIFK